MDMDGCADAGAGVEADAGNASPSAPMFMFMLACVPPCADTAPCVRARTRAEGCAVVRTGAVVESADGYGFRARGWSAAVPVPLYAPSPAPDAGDACMVGAWVPASGEGSRMSSPDGDACAAVRAETLPCRPPSERVPLFADGDDGRAGGRMRSGLDVEPSLP